MNYSVIPSSVPVLHFFGSGTEGQGQKLHAKTYAGNGKMFCKNPDGLDFLFQERGITGSVSQQNSIRSV
jgi:hypothetical protein